MKRRWIIGGVIGVALISANAIIWHFVRADLTARQLAKDAAGYRTRAEKGDAESQFKLGVMYSRGKGVPKDYSEAARWYRRSAAQGYAKAEYNLSDLYREGKGVEQDRAEAERWCRKAAEQGDPKAQDALGFMYYTGYSVPRDYAEAARWYRKSADQGYVNGEYDLGFMYYWGYGVAQDRVEANRLFRAAASQGDERAQQAIGSRKLNLPTRSKIFLSLDFLGAAFLGIAFLRSRRSYRSREHIITGLTALLLIFYFILELWWYFYFVHLPWSPTTTSFYFIRHFLGGVLVAMLLSIVHPKSAKISLIGAAALFAALVVIAVILFEVRHLPVRIWFLCLGGFPIGMSVTAAIFLWLDPEKSTAAG